MIRRDLIPTSIDGIEFDALMSKTKTMESDIPDYPVESGFSVSDNITVKPVTLSLELYITPTPVTWAEEHSGGLDWVDSVCEELEDLYFEKKLVTIETPDETFENMGITSMSIADSQDEGYSKVISISAKKVYETETDTAEIPSEIAQSGTSGVNAGAASTSTTAQSSSASLSASASASSASSGASKSAQEAAQKEDSQKGHSILYGVADGLNLFDF